MIYFAYTSFCTSILTIDKNCLTINFFQFFYLRSRRDGEDDKPKNSKRVTKEAKSSRNQIEVQLKPEKTLVEEENFIPRLVANGTKLVHSWEDQYYVVNEYRANAHQVNILSLNNFKL